MSAASHELHTEQLFVFVSLVSFYRLYSVPPDLTMAIRIARALHALLLLLLLQARVAPEEFGGAAREAGDGAEERVFARDGVARDMASVSMFRVFERYREEPHSSQRDGNTVRSFKPAPSKWPRGNRDTRTL